MPFMRNSFVTPNSLSKCLRSLIFASAVIWWTTASGSARATTSPTSSAFRPFITTGSTPTARSLSTFSRLRVDATTS